MRIYIHKYTFCFRDPQFKSSWLLPLSISRADGIESSKTNNFILFFCLVADLHQIGKTEVWQNDVFQYANWQNPTVGATLVFQLCIRVWRFAKFAKRQFGKTPIWQNGNTPNSTSSQPQGEFLCLQLS